MTYLFAFFILYFLTGVIFVAYDFKIFQKLIFYIRALFSPGGTYLNPKLCERFHSIYNPIDSPGYVSGRNYGFALLSIIIWPLVPRIFLPWFYLARQPGIKFLFNFYVLPAIVLVALYLAAIQSLVGHGKVWQITLALVIFSGIVWWLCRRRDREMEERRERRT